MRAADAAGAASNLGATLYRCVVPPRFLPTTARSAADADVGLSLYGLRSAWAAMGLYQLWVVSLMVGTAYLIWHLHCSEC